MRYHVLKRNGEYKWDFHLSTSNLMDALEYIQNNMHEKAEYMIKEVSI